MLRGLIEFFVGDKEVRKARERIENLTHRQRIRELKARESKELVAARAVTRRHFMKVVTAEVLGVAFAAIGTSATKKLLRQRSLPEHPKETKADPQPQENGPQSDRIQELIQYQEHQRMRTLRALERFQNFSPETQKLFKMLQEHAFYSVPMGPRATNRIMTQTGFEKFRDNRDPNEFEIVFMPEEYSASLPSSILWQGHENVLRIAADIDSNEWLAILLYHELSHVWDQHFGGENPDNPDEWNKGEAKAHELECELLRNWQPQAYAKLVEEEIPLWENGRNMQAILSLGEKLFPMPSRTSETAKAQAYGTFVICVAFEHGKRNGIPTEKIYRENFAPPNMR